MDIEDDVIGTRLFEFFKESHPDLLETLVLSEDKDEEDNRFIAFQIKHPENGRIIEFCSVEEHVYFVFSEYTTHIPLYPRPVEAFEHVVTMIREILSGQKVALVWLMEDTEVPSQAELIPVGEEAFFEFLYEGAAKVYVEGWSEEDDLDIK